MKTKSWLLSSLILGLSSLPGCATTEQNRMAETQPAEKAQVAEIAVHSSTKEPVAENTAAPAAIKVQEPPVAKEISKQSDARLDRYTVAAGDTLALIAAKQSVYGDAQLWPLLYVANNNQIGPGGLIFPNQVLVINRNFTPAEVKSLTGRAKSLLPRGSATKPAVAQNDTAPAVTKASPAKVAAIETKAPGTAVAKAKEEAKPSVKKEETKPAVVEAKTQEAPAAKEEKPAVVEAKAPEVAATKAKDETNPADYLAAARRAFAAGDVSWSIQYYNSYLAVKNSDANAWGELGNVYYFEGMLLDSAQAYFNAANVLIDHGHTARALKLMPAIEEGNPSLADAIYLRLTTVKR